MEKQVLRFHADGKFRILMISDFHAYTADSAGFPKMKAGIEALLEHTRPDLVLLGGDQCMKDETPEQVRAYMMQIMEPVLRRGLPWAHVFGNHDREMGLPLEEEEKVYESIPGCLSEAGPEEISGVGNYCLPILSSASDAVAYHIWALDSHAEFRDYVARFGLPKDTQFILPNSFGYGRVNSAPMFDQVMWYYQESLRREQAAGRRIPAIMYMHNPILEYCLVARNPEECSAIGNKREDITATELNSGLFMACLQRGDVKGIFCGHEHLCDFQGKYCGVTLALDGSIGYNMSTHDDLRGGRVIDLTEDGGMETHQVRLMEIMGLAAQRNPDFFEGGCNYFFRVRH